MRTSIVSPITSFVCFDIETTGLDPLEDKIIEIGAIKVKDKKIVDQFKEFINPNMKLPPKIIAITNITDDMLSNGDEEENVVKRFLDFCQDEVLIGHNILFDYSFVKTALGRYDIPFERRGIDTLMLSKKLHSSAGSKSLESMCRLYNIKNEHAHRAYDDAKATALLYVHLCNEFFDLNGKDFIPKALIYKTKKVQPITAKQKNYLLDLIKYHNINIETLPAIETLTQSSASKLIDSIILTNGRMA